MEEIYSWIRNLVGFFIFVSLLGSLLPGKNYDKYIRLFAGMVLILLVMQPLTGKLRLEERIADFYETLVFQYEAEELKENILGMEKQQLERMIEQYEEAVSMDVAELIREEVEEVTLCEAVIDDREGSDTFGSVIKLQVKGQVDSQSDPAWAADKAKQKIMSYYHLEEGNVEVQIMAKEG